MLAGFETLRQWHCGCGYTNAGFDPCAGCHRKAPREIRSNTRARPAPVAQTALVTEFLALYSAGEQVVVAAAPSWLTELAVWAAASLMLLIAMLLFVG